MRESSMRRLKETVDRPGAESRGVISAVNTMLSASRINLQNISAALKAIECAEIVPRMKEIERLIDEQN
jgi:predicted amino acid-binding ACT domain protein